MAILQDTILDARRPLAGGWLRRSAIEDDVELGPADDAVPSTGMQTVFRFQKEGVGRPPEASFQPTREETRRAADPLSVAVEAGRPKSPSSNGAHPLSDGITGRTESRVGRQEDDGSPFGVEEVREEVASEETVQSLSVLTPAGAKPNRPEYVSKISGGGDQLVDLSVVPFSSQYTGRGAPSETSSPSPSARADLPDAPAAPSPGGSEPAVGAGQARSASARPGQAAVPALRDGGREPAGQALRGTSHAVEAIRHAEFSPGRLSGTAAAMPAGKVPTKDPVPSSAPNLVIGRIDVVVVAHEIKAPAATRDTDRGFLSRNYLRRL